MYFTKEKGKIFLDLRGDFILTHNDNLIRARIHGAAPKKVRNGKYIEGIGRFTIRQKLQASIAALQFIWKGDNERFDHDD